MVGWIIRHWKQDSSQLCHFSQEIKRTKMKKVKNLGIDFIEANHQNLSGKSTCWKDFGILGEWKKELCTYNTLGCWPFRTEALIPQVLSCIGSWQFSADFLSGNNLTEESHFLRSMTLVKATLFNEVRFPSHDSLVGECLCLLASVWDTSSSTVILASEFSVGLAQNSITMILQPKLSFLSVCFILLPYR